MRVLSGIQPSGRLHLGNYFGAMRMQIQLQQAGHECFYFIANQHALTTLPRAETLREYTDEVALGYLAVGLDPEKTIFFRQSDVPEVMELAWVLACCAPMGRMQRMVSYKDKVAQGLSPNLGLFNYPILQAADILAYRSEVVPVGEDQRQHIELTREVAGKFNATYGELLTLPEPYILEEVAVVPGIDGRKMSKSYGNTIELFEDEKSIKRKIMKIVTDSTPVEKPKNPDTCNVFALLKLVTDQQERQLWEQRYRQGGVGYGQAKQRLYELLMEKLRPVRARYAELKNNMDYIHQVLRKGGQKARAVAAELMQEIRNAIGIVVDH